MQGIAAWLRVFAAAILLGFAGAAPAQVSGKDFFPVNPPQATDTGKKIEVIEFFSYGCPHCASLEPSLRNWLKRKPADVEFRRVPIIFQPAWEPLARLYYALETMGVVDRLHGEVFAAIHEQHLRLQDPKALADWIATKGVDKQKFMDNYNSFSVQSRTRLAPEVASRYKSGVDGGSQGIPFTPAFVVDGRYLTAPSMTNDLQGFYNVLDQLVATARKTRGGNK